MQNTIVNLKNNLLPLLKNKIVLISIVVIVVALVFSWGFIFKQKPSYVEQSPKYYDSIQELEINDMVVGTGEELKEGMNAKLNYRGTLTNGFEFDSSYADGRVPFVLYNVGKANVIEGWNKGLIGMKVGGKRKLYIPAKMGYGDRSLSQIPANSTLIFEVELLEIVK